MFIMKRLLLPLLSLLVLHAPGFAQEFSSVVPGRTWSFPQDHGAHPDFKTEWWYFTGHLQSKQGLRFGFQWTVFRSALLKPGEAVAGKSAWRARDLYFGHLAISDLDTKKFYYEESASRGALNLAGSSAEGFKVWLPGFRGSSEGETMRLQAQRGDLRLDLRLEEKLPPVLHGSSGYSPKSTEAGRASYYYTMVPLSSAGTLAIGGKEFSVSGQGWMDHEFGSGQLGTSQTGWDWFGLPLGTKGALMIYRLRDPQRGDYLSGTYINAEAEVFPLNAGEIELKSSQTWKSSTSQASYPLHWEIRIPRFALNLNINASFPPQELVTKRSTQITYWEGSVTVRGKIGAHDVDTMGYLEMTGYAKPMESGYFSSSSEGDSSISRNTE